MTGLHRPLVILGAALIVSAAATWVLERAVVPMLLLLVGAPLVVGGIALAIAFHLTVAVTAVPGVPRVKRDEQENVAGVSIADRLPDIAD
ncbi:hypothetical protein [Curtobacterium sp. 1544]|uniref:hypothetical protein n=1 Tax=Curtobacterium sp. 1544 TaxID=3156417 RepID=UPI0033937C81